MQTILEFFVKKSDWMKKWQWYISVALDIGFYVLMIYLFLLTKDLCLASGQEQLATSCDKCLATCHNETIGFHNINETTGGYGHTNTSLPLLNFTGNDSLSIREVG
jgi:hypothetical protein